ncbi:cell division protein FtsA [Candidatus Dependentiae bacterium HGW-Dependentiae-1]|nr:MAG: cell division protein FtsA [Candidatus Dependentiae bacterium HGW-Dependentiae-1]
MAKASYDRVIVSLDVGTTKMCVLVANQLDNQHVEIIGVGKAPSDGLRKGVVVDIAKTVHSIKIALKEAELMAGIPIDAVNVGISGGHIQSINSHGMVPITKGEVREQDIANVLASARAIPLEQGYQILHVLPQYFIIDGRDKIQDPRGMHGVRLEVQAHIILGALASVQNLVTCCEMAGVKVIDLVLEQLASAQAVLSPDERELGVGVLDIGGGTSDFAIYQNGSIRHTMVLPVAGNHFTNDIAIGLRTTVRDAERVKKMHGLANPALAEKDELIEIEMVQGTQKQFVQLADLAAIIHPRAYELFSLVSVNITKHQLRHCMSTGLVLTGGGSLLAGMRELAQDIFDMPVRLGCPHVMYDLPETLDNPIYATAYGLLLNAVAKERNGIFVSSDAPVAKRVLMRMRSWVSDFF